MKIREGRFYRTRDGQKVGPIERGTSSSEARYWTAKSVLDGGFFSWWFKDGSFWPDGHEMRTANNAANDIIAEWSEPMGLTERELCRECHGAISRTDTSGLCWSCMPCA